MPRDVEILCDLARYRYLTTTQATTLRFPANQVASRRLRTLEEAGYLARFQPRAVPGHGSCEYIHHLTKDGAELVANHLGVDLSEIHYPKRVAKTRHGWRMDHILSVVQFWLSLDLASSDGQADLVRFIPDWHGTYNKAKTFVPVLKDTVPHPLKPSQTLPFLPDAAFVLERHRRQALFFLEVDRTTETVSSSRYPDFTDKLLAYAGYRKENAHRRYGDFLGFRVLVTTLNQRRLEHYREAAEALNVGKLFLFALSDSVTPEAILSPVWQPSALETEPVALVSSTAKPASV